MAGTQWESSESRPLNKFLMFRALLSISVMLATSARFARGLQVGVGVRVVGGKYLGRPSTPMATLSNSLSSPFRLFSSIPGDNSAEAKSRRPFSGPKSGPDDSQPKGSILTERQEWGKLGLMDELSSGLSSAGLSSPTPIQSMSVPSQLAGDSVGTFKEMTVLS